MLSGMRPCHSVCLVLVALASLGLGQEELSTKKLRSFEELAELSFDELEDLEESSYDMLSYDAMLKAEVSCFKHRHRHRLI